MGDVWAMLTCDLHAGFWEAARWPGLKNRLAQARVLRINEAWAKGVNLPVTALAYAEASERLLRQAAKMSGRRLDEVTPQKPRSAS